VFHVAHRYQHTLVTVQTTFTADIEKPLDFFINATNRLYLSVLEDISGFIQVLKLYEATPAENELPMLARHLLAELKVEHDQLIERVDRIERQLKAWHASSPVSQRLASIPGIGVLTATALVASVGEGQDFRNGRQLAAYLGLVPRQSSSGGKERLLGISKRGDGYLRGLLIHGARAVIHHIRRRLKAGRPGGNPWVEQLLQRCHVNEAAVALANKMARTAWVLLARNETYCPARPV